MLEKDHQRKSKVENILQAEKNIMMERKGSMSSMLNAGMMQ